MSVIPASNPAGNNQTNPVNSMLPKASTGPATAIPGSPQQTPISNSFVPAAASTSTTTPANQIASPAAASSSTTSAQNGYITPTVSGTNGQNNLQNQLEDIYGKGVGTSLYTLLNSMSGTNSTILQEFISSLAPQEATAKSNINASLGASGVSGNSSVNAIAQSNLQSQETAAVAGESASLTQNQESLTAQLLSGMEGSSAKEVATSGWSVFGDVMNNITGDVGNLLGGSYSDKSTTASGNTGASTGTISSGTNGVSASVGGYTVNDSEDTLLGSINTTGLV